MLTVDDISAIHERLGERFGVGEAQDLSVIHDWCAEAGVDLDALILIVGHETARIGTATDLDPTNPGDHETICEINAACIEAFMAVFEAGKALGARDSALDGLDFDTPDAESFEDEDGAE